MASGVALQERELMGAILERLAAMTRHPVWPEFRPAAMPLAIAMHDSGATWRSSPPDSALPPDATVEDVAGQTIVRCPGIDPRIVANSIADFDGIPTATVIVPPGGMMPDTGGRWTRYVGLAAHELFHVHQAERGFAPGGNEAALLTFPWDDSNRLALVRAEWSALRRAVDAREAADARSALGDAIALRRERITVLSDDELAYVRATELMEGTSRYVEARARGDAPPGDGFWMDEASLELRSRCYDTGLVWCLLLDRFGPDDWKASIAAHPSDGWNLDEIAMAVEPGRGDASRAAGSWRDLVPAATDDIASERTRRAELLALLRSSGKTRVVARAAPGLELRVAGFDPMNVRALDATTVVHGQYLELTAGDTTMTVLDRAAITTSNGDHPLFAVLLEAEVVGDASDAPLWPASGLRIKGSHTVTEEDGVVTIVLGAPIS